MEGARSGAGSVLVTNGSGCGSVRPKKHHDPNPQHWSFLRDLQCLTRVVDEYHISVRSGVCGTSWRAQWSGRRRGEGRPAQPWSSGSATSTASAGRSAAVHLGTSTSAPTSLPERKVRAVISRQKISCNFFRNQG
jgi:hypothetical protein